MAYDVLVSSASSAPNPLEDNDTPNPRENNSFLSLRVYV